MSKSEKVQKPAPDETPPKADCADNGGNGGGNGANGSDNGSLVDLDVGTGGDGALISAEVGGSHLIDIDVGASEEYSGVSLEVAALADQGLLGDLGSDGLVSIDVGQLPLDGIGALPDLPDIGGILDSCAC